MTAMLTCGEARPRIDELLDGELPAADAIALDDHIEACDACAAALAHARSLRVALAAMPVPGPRPGFAAEALAQARRRHIGLVGADHAHRPQQAGHRPRRLARPATWWGGLAAAAAAAAVAILLWGGPQDGFVDPEPAAAEFTLALYEPREIAIAIDADRAMAGARVTVRVEGGVELVGFPDTPELSWETDLEAGTNMLALPVLAYSVETGRLTALVEHDERRQQIELTLQGTATPGNGQP